MWQAASLRRHRRLPSGATADRLSRASRGLPAARTCVIPGAVEPKESTSGLERLRFVLRATGVPLDPPNPLRNGIHSRGYLPHVKREGASYFVTFRLTDSLPREVLFRFGCERMEQLRRVPSHAGPKPVEEILREFHRRVERYLDQGAGACHLRQPEIADVVAEALRHFHGKQYLLDEWVVMPNHVHVVLWPMPNFTLSEILRSRKRHTARQANLILGRTGETFWQRESYDHWIRNDAEKARIRRHLRMNPVKARLCRAPRRCIPSAPVPTTKRKFLS